MSPLEKVAQAISKESLCGDPVLCMQKVREGELEECNCMECARAAVEALRPFIHECVGVTSTSEYPIDKAVDAKIDALLAGKPDA
jgi:hypothetical protein